MRHVIWVCMELLIDFTMKGVIAELWKYSHRGQCYPQALIREHQRFAMA